MIKITCAEEGRDRGWVALHHTDRQTIRAKGATREEAIGKLVVDLGTVRTNIMAVDADEPRVAVDQGVLAFAPAYGHASILATRGEITTYAAAYLLDRIPVPAGPGLFAWAGDISIPSTGRGLPTALGGSWHPATLADFGRFGLPVPEGGVV